MELYNSEELLIIISLSHSGSDEDKEEGKKAFFLIVKRFRERLIKYCVHKLYTRYKSVDQVFDSSDAETLVWNSFHTLKDKAHNFDLEKSTTNDIEDAVFGYIAGFVKNEFYAFYFNTRSDKIKLPEYQVDLSKTGELVHTRKIALQISNESLVILQGMNIKQREVFLATEEFRDFGTYLPREIKQLLCEKLNLAPDSITNYRKRAKQYLTEKFNPNEKS